MAVVTGARLAVGPYRVQTRALPLPEALRAQLATYSPRSHLGAIVRSCFQYLPPELAGELLTAISSVVVIESRLYGTVFRGSGQVERLGLLSAKVITTAGVNYLVDAMQNLVEAENLRYHGYGTGTGSEGTGNTALGSELSTQYSPDNTRPTGSLTEGASANIYRTVATLSPDSGGTLAITEHGIFSQAATGGGTLWDRSVFSAINLVAGSDSLQTTYDCTFSAGG